ncbi:MAG: recombination factor protein RarA, partial [Burkholderiaceae bacterium]|nr:recombination factor protein RarA [Burkholderiaceae bacterium]
AVENIGWPESRIILSQCAIYLATSPKSNSAYMAIDAAIAEVRNSGDLSIPMHIRNAPTQLMKDLGHGHAYRYAHDEPHAYATGESYLPEGMVEPRWYEPVERGLESKIAERMAFLRGLDDQANQS